MKNMFEMSDLGEMAYFLGMEVLQSKQGIFISQKSFALKILEKFFMENCKSACTPIAQGEKLTSKGVLKGSMRGAIGVSLVICFI